MRQGRVETASGQSAPVRRKFGNVESPNHLRHQTTPLPRTDQTPTIVLRCLPCLLWATSLQMFGRRGNPLL